MLNMHHITASNKKEKEKMSNYFVHHHNTPLFFQKVFVKMCFDWSDSGQTFKNFVPKNVRGKKDFFRPKPVF